MLVFIAQTLENTLLVKVIPNCNRDPCGVFPYSALASQDISDNHFTLIAVVCANTQFVFMKKLNCTVA